MRWLLQRLALYGFHVGIVRPVLKWVVGVRFRRRSLIPSGPCLVVSNHNSHLDAAVLMSLFPLRRLTRVHPVAAADYFGKTWLLRTLAMWCMNGIPIERRPAAGRDPLSRVAEALDAGESLIFFPEGSRGEAGVVARFRPGVGVLARSVPGLLVVPVFLSGPERIWPRGNVVPVPLSIDVHVGRPRAYSPELDSRTIADRVQHDVLALAPPRPPVPGPRPLPPLRVSICSVDAEYRHAVFRLLTERLGRLGPTRGVSEPMLEADATGVREAAGPVPAGRILAWLDLLSWLFRTRGRLGGHRFVDVIERAQLDEALSHVRDARFLVVEGSAMVDLLASPDGDLYRDDFDESGLNLLMQCLTGQKDIPLGRWWRFLRRAREIWLVNVFDLARPPVPDVLVHLPAPVTRVMQRLRSEGRELLPHESEGSLERLQEAYRQVGEFLRKRRKVEFVDVVGDEPNPENAASRVEEICRRLIDGADSATPGG